MMRFLRGDGVVINDSHTGVFFAFLASRQGVEKGILRLHFLSVSLTAVDMAAFVEEATRR
jgi:hypothetical protein